jgi:hypothetical protein
VTAAARAISLLDCSKHTKTLTEAKDRPVIER